MRTLGITLGVIAGIAGILLLVNFIVKQDIETQGYEVIDEVGDVEIRKYDKSIFATYTMAGEKYSQTSGQGFRNLANYIFGGNKEGEEIAMTSPVHMAFEGDSVSMSFVMPAEYDMSTLPEPKNSKVKLEEFEGGVYAAIQFGGWANDNKIEKHKKQLIETLEANGIEYVGAPRFLGYNAPYDVIDRRNEVLIRVVNREQ